MPRDARIVLDGAVYHIITRGNQRQRLFREESDYLEYLMRVRLYKVVHKFKLYGYCLMPNHAHLIGEPVRPVGLSSFMKGLSSSYTAYFNNKYRKVGHLWQGRFKSRIIVKDKYLLNCINYVELNPVRANTVASPLEYQWSSYRERNLDVNNKARILDNISF